MFKNTFQSGFLSILYSIGSKPLQIWDKEGAIMIVQNYILLASVHVAATCMQQHVHNTLLVLLLLCWCAVHNGHIKRITDEEIQSSVLEIMSSNVSTTYITCPADPQKTLGIKLPFLVMIVKVSRSNLPLGPAPVCKAEVGLQPAP
jgi:hypothetical protein